MERYRALLWREAASADDRDAPLRELGLELARLDGPASATSLRVNRTRRLSWIAATDGAAIASRTVATLAASPAVEWISTCYRSARGSKTQCNLFAVNPARVFLRRAAIELAGGTAALDPSLAVDVSGAPTRPGLVALSVRGGDAIAVAQRINRRLVAAGSRDEVRFETIPFLVPTPALRHTDPDLLARAGSGLGYREQRPEGKLHTNARKASGELECLSALSSMQRHAGS